MVPVFMFVQLMKSLKYIHSAGIIHRDIKPANILLSEQCDLKVSYHAFKHCILQGFFAWYTVCTGTTAYFCRGCVVVSISFGTHQQTTNTARIYAVQLCDFGLARRRESTAAGYLRF